MDDKLLQLLSGTFGLVVLAFLVALGIYWLLFPMFVYSKLNRMIKKLEAIETGIDGQSLVQRNFFSDARAKIKSEAPAERS